MQPFFLYTKAYWKLFEVQKHLNT